MPPALEISALTKRYDDGTLALDALDLTIPDGAFFGLLGPNGAGKTTLINSVAGLVRVTSGSIRVFGHEALGDGLRAARRPHDRRPLAAGREPRPLPDRVRVAALPRRLLRAGRATTPQRRAEEMIDVFDLRAKRDTRTTRLSGGMKRRLLLARALLHEPRLVILDEPTAGVDYELRMELWRYIRLLHERGTTILLTTHYLEEAEALCEQIALIRDGRIAALDTPAGLRERYDATRSTRST